MHPKDTVLRRCVGHGQDSSDGVVVTGLDSSAASVPAGGTGIVVLMEECLEPQAEAPGRLSHESIW